MTAGATSGGDGDPRGGVERRGRPLRCRRSSRSKRSSARSNAKAARRLDAARSRAVLVRRVRRARRTRAVVVAGRRTPRRHPRRRWPTGRSSAARRPSSAPTRRPFHAGRRPASGPSMARRRWRGPCWRRSDAGRAAVAVVERSGPVRTSSPARGRAPMSARSRSGSAYRDLTATARARPRAADPPLRRPVRPGDRRVPSGSGSSTPPVWTTSRSPGPARTSRVAATTTRSAGRAS